MNKEPIKKYVMRELRELLHPFHEGWVIVADFANARQYSPVYVRSAIRNLAKEGHLTRKGNGAGGTYIKLLYTGEVNKI